MIFSNGAQVVVGETERKGKSLFARRLIKKDEVILVVSGKIIPYSTDYTVPIDHYLNIEPREPGSETQYLCHSCEPNAGIKNRTLVVAMKEINEGEEVTISYAFIGYDYGNEHTLGGEDVIVLDRACYCGKPSCVGTLQCYKHMPPVWRVKYREYISDYLLDDDRYPYGA